MTLREVLMIVGMAAVTIATRYPVLALFRHVEFPPLLLAALKYIPPAVLAAIVVPGLVAPQGDIDLSLRNDFLIAGLFAAVIAWRTNNLLLTILLGMAGLWVYRWLVM